MTLRGVTLTDESRPGGRTVPTSDLRRQEMTASALLDRFTERPVQLLADEVGMGKTYVALAAAASLKSASNPLRVAVLVPNRELARKWEQELFEFNEASVQDRRRRFTPLASNDSFVSENLQDLAGRSAGRRLTIIRYGAHGSVSKKLADENDTIRAAAWSVSTDRRLSHVKAALRAAFDVKQRPHGQGELLRSLNRLRGATDPLIPHPRPTGRNAWTPEQIEGRSGTDLWNAAVDSVAAAPLRPYAQLRLQVRAKLLQAARGAILADVGEFDLVIVDEAHNWVNRAKGADESRLALLHVAHRALLLTATPLQLTADDLPNLLGQFADLGQRLRRRPSRKLAEELPDMRDGLRVASNASAAFRREWSAADPSHTEVAERDRNVPGRLPTQVQDAVDAVKDANTALEETLQPWLIRHRRSRAHRRFLIGSEFTASAVGPSPPAISEPHVLHDAAGLESSHAQVTQLALMRLVGLTLAQQGAAGRSTLAASMTGVYTTAERSKDVRSWANKTPEAQPYMDLVRKRMQAEQRLRSGTNVRSESIHPKLKATLDVVDELWHSGEKILVYCWRVPTAEVVADAIRARLDARTDLREHKSLQQRLSRDPLQAIAEDRVVASLCLAGEVNASYAELVSSTMTAARQTMLAEQAADMRRLTSIHQRLLAEAAIPHAQGWARDVLKTCAAQTPPASRRNTGLSDPVLDDVISGPNILTGDVPEGGEQHRRLALALGRFTEVQHQRHPDTAFARRREMIGMIQSTLRSTHTLARLKLSSADQPAAKEVADAYTIPLAHHRRLRSSPSMLDRFADLVEEFTEISDEVLVARTKEFSSTLQRSPVDLITGSGGSRKRQSAFDRFNGPLFPDVLVCTQVGGEGIDLHRFCRVVIHYDLSFNPAKLEQRTGRCDRIGSKAAREGELIVAVPLLAGSYDERIYDTLLQRDREQEALIGAGVAGGGVMEIDEDQRDSVDEVPDRQRIRHGPPPLPEWLVEELRCDFSIWRA